MEPCSYRELNNVLQRLENRYSIEKELLSNVQSDYDKFCEQFVEDLEIAIRCIKDCIDEYYK